MHPGKSFDQHQKRAITHTGGPVDSQSSPQGKLPEAGKKIKLSDKTEKTLARIFRDFRSGKLNVLSAEESAECEKKLLEKVETEPSV